MLTSSPVGSKISYEPCRKTCRKLWHRDLTNPVTRAGLCHRVLRSDDLSEAASVKGHQLQPAKQEISSQTAKTELRRGYLIAEQPRRLKKTWPSKNLRLNSILHCSSFKNVKTYACISEQLRSAFPYPEIRITGKIRRRRATTTEKT